MDANVWICIKMPAVPFSLFHTEKCFSFNSHTNNMQQPGRGKTHKVEKYEIHLWIYFKKGAWKECVSTLTEQNKNLWAVKNTHITQRGWFPFNVHHRPPVYLRSARTLYRPPRLNRHSFDNRDWLVRQLAVFAMSICFCASHNTVGCDKHCRPVTFNLEPLKRTNTSGILIWDYLS